MLAALLFLAALVVIQPVLWFSAKLAWTIACWWFHRKVASATMQEP